MDTHSATFARILDQVQIQIRKVGIWIAHPICDELQAKRTFVKGWCCIYEGIVWRVRLISTQKNLTRPAKRSGLADHCCAKVLSKIQSSFCPPENHSLTTFLTSPTPLLPIEMVKQNFKFLQGQKFVAICSPSSAFKGCYNSLLYFHKQKSFHVNFIQTF